MHFDITELTRLAKMVDPGTYLVALNQKKREILLEHIPRVVCKRICREVESDENTLRRQFVRLVKRESAHEVHSTHNTRGLGHGSHLLLSRMWGPEEGAH